jgi:hypothetical protein
VSGLQLFGMVRAVSEGTLTKADAQALLLETVGVVKGYDDWRGFLSKA